MLSRTRLDSYAEKAGALERAAVAAAYDEIAAWVASNPDAPFAVAAAEVASIIERASELPMSAAASLARALFSLIAADAGEDAPEGPVGADFPAGAVASELEKHEASYGSGDAEAFSRTAARMAGDAVSGAANRQMLADAGEDTLFARVPTSPRACPWCIALASQGFVYASEAKAGKFDSWHANCRCRVIPSYDRQIEGYDPDEYMRIYLADKRIDAMDLPGKAKDAIRSAYRDSYGGGHAYNRSDLDGVFDEGIASLRKGFRSLPKRQRADYYESTVLPTLAEIGWAYGFDLSGELFYSKTGSPVGAFPSGEELGVIVAISDGGQIRINAQHETKVPDLLINGHYIDIKAPINASGTRDRMKDGVSQLKSVGESRMAVVLDLTKNMEPSESIRAAGVQIELGLYHEIIVVENWDVSNL